MAYVFTSRDADQADHTVPQGEPFTTYWLEGELMEVNHSWVALERYDAEDLARYGITRTEVPDPPPPVPAAVSRMQLKRALNQLGLLTTVNAGVEASGNEDLKIYWADTSEFHRDHPALNAALTALGFSAAQANSAFILAASLS